MQQYRISGVPIVNNREDMKVGIITNRDMRFQQILILQSMML